MENERAGGRDIGKFFYDQIEQLISWHSGQLPDYTPEPEEVEAGFERLQEVFGSFATITEVGITLGLDPDILLNWSARRFWTTQLYLSHKSHVQAEYSKLIMKRK